MNQIIYTGKNIRQSQTDLLQPCTLQQLFETMANPEGELATDCKRLRNIRRIDVQAYHKAKLCLPYFAVSVFAGNIRKTENFTEANYMVIDLDNCAESITACNEFKKRLTTNNPEILLAYISPSGTGMKLLFKLQKSITDTRQYTLFYKKFIQAFCIKNQIEQFADHKNCDVTRVCFLASDKEIYFNPAAQTLSIPDNLMQNTGPENIQPHAGSAINEKTYRQILAALKNQPASAKPPKQHFVPEILKQVEPIVAEAVQNYRFTVTDIKPINYGLQFTINHNLNKAVINVFYGKKGFSVVAVPRNDTHKELNELVQKIVSLQLFEIEKEISNLLYNSLNDTPTP